MAPVVCGALKHVEVLSPILFNFYFSKLMASPEEVEWISRNDENIILFAGHDVDGFFVRLSCYLQDHTNFFTAINTQLFPAKPNALLVTKNELR